MEEEESSSNELNSPRIFGSNVDSDSDIMTESEESKEIHVVETSSYDNEVDGVTGLNDLVQQQKSQIIEYQEKVKLLESCNNKFQVYHKELENKLEVLLRQNENAVRDKESMVMRYAVSEKEVIRQQIAKELADKKLKDAHKENELLQHKLTSLSADKLRICNMLDSKSYDLKNSQHEIERLKTDLCALETKLKWSQNNLKTEIELRKEAETKIGCLNNSIQEYIDAAEKIKKDASDSVNEFLTSQENRAHVLDQQVKELQAGLILLKHERDDKEQQVKHFQLDQERLQKKQNEMLQENNSLSMKVQQLEKERAEMEHKLSELRECADQQRQDAADLHSKTAQLEKLKLQLKNEQEQAVAMQEQIAVLKQRNVELISDMESCRIHEAELLSFTHQLTDKNVRLQSEFTSMETKVQQLTCEQAVLKRVAKEHETKGNLVSAQLLELRNRKSEEAEKVTRDRNEKVKLCEKLTQELGDQKDEYSLMRRKLELSVKEINKELIQCRKKLEQYENTGIASSSGSSTSLNTEDRNGHTPDPTSEKIKVVQPERELDRQALIEHIIKLQRSSARKSEKMDFLEEHVNTLVAELQKKSRLLQSYILREQAGTLSSNKMDNNKANIAKYSGIMASMYGAKIVDENLTLELSLDINRKLQAVLEDALLKNITLKENVDTLGAEIEKLMKKTSN